MNFDQESVDIKQKCVIVTGATGGIGLATVRTLLEAGYSVAAIDLDEKKGKSLTEASTKDESNLSFWKADVSSEKEVEKVVSDIANRYETIYGLVNNAGISSSNFGPPERTKDLVSEHLETLFKVNVFGAFYFTKYTIPHMISAMEGSIVNISSMYAIVGSTDSSVYSATKGSLVSMTISDSLQYAEYNVRINAVLPGFIRTPMLERLSLGKGLGNAFFDQAIEKIPLKRIGEPKEVSSLIKFLISEQSSYITGAQFVIDGGYTVR